MEKTYMKTEKQIKLDYIGYLGDYAKFYFKDTAGEARKTLKKMYERKLITHSEIKEFEYAKKYYAYAYSSVLNRNVWHDLELYKKDFKTLLEELEITDEDFDDQ